MGNVSYDGIVLPDNSKNSNYLVNLQQPVATVICCYLEHLTAISTAKIQASNGNPDLINQVQPISPGDLKGLIDQVQLGFRWTETK